VPDYLDLFASAERCTVALAPKNDPARAQVSRVGKERGRQRALEYSRRESFQAREMARGRRLRFLFGRRS